MTGDARSERRGQTYERLLRQERLILDVTEQLAGALENSGVTRAELARRMGRTPGFVSQVLNGGRNLTLRTIADIAGALSLRPSLKVPCERTDAPARPRMIATEDRRSKQLDLPR
ncbi:MAG: helix-turn-helix transcriptional regulator [Acidobacteria bacterium]|nr:helix-turn-helix transcriptional regulator [Acidobacteriota bacterium]